jgi:hypothetical protein
MGNDTPHIVQLPSGALLFKRWLDVAAQQAAADYTFALVRSRPV